MLQWNKVGMTEKKQELNQIRTKIKSGGLCRIYLNKHSTQIV